MKWSTVGTFARMPTIAAALVCLCTPQIALSADFKRSSLGPNAPDLIEVSGKLLQGDEAKFIETAIKSADAIVVFRSGGGNLLAGIEIGKAIRLKGFSTLAPDDMYCASACALAWLAGRVRFMSDTARVGFHAVYTSEDGGSRISSAGNAITGAYLNQLGLPTSAIIYITDAPPDGMQWLNFADAQRVGIEVKRLNLNPVVAAAPPVQSHPATPEVSSPISVFAPGAKLLGHFNDWSAYTAMRAGKKECFAYSAARNSAAKTDGVYLFVSTRPWHEVRNELSITTNYQVKQGSEGSALEVGGEQFALWGSGNGAWVNNLREQARIVDTMRNDGQLSVRLQTAKGAVRHEVYSLKGFAGALDRVAQECR
jgi:hypothetical protein